MVFNFGIVLKNGTCIVLLHIRQARRLSMYDWQFILFFV